MPTPDPADLPKPGDLIAGKYKVEDILGKGGMGVVFAARHLALRQRVAIKLLLPAGMRLPGARERFLREAQAAAAIQSEHVARVLDVGTLETGAPYMVMEHLSGTDLSRLLKTRKQLPIAEAVDFILQALEAIAEAHSLGIIHRDLKPQNLFLTTRPSGPPIVKVLDFGLSKMAPEPGDAPEASLTATDLIVGSPHYMSPEQIRGLKHTDARTDLWALGVILYQLIAGRRPFEGDGLPAVCASIAADPLYPLQTYRPETPPTLDALIQRCLEKDPTRRVQRATELAQGLAPFRAAQAIPVTEHTATTRPIVPVRPAPAPADSAPVPVSTLDPTTARLSTWAQTQRQPRRMAMPLVAAGGAAAILCALAAVSQVRFRANEGSPAVAGQADTAATTAPEATAGSQPGTPAITAAPEAAATASPRPASTAQPIARQAEVAMAPSSKPTAASPAPIETPAATSKPSAEPAPRAKRTGDMADRWE